jgi:hypothetical protein
MCSYPTESHVPIDCVPDEAISFIPLPRSVPTRAAHRSVRIHRLDQKTTTSWANYNLRQVLAGLIRHRDGRHARTYGLDHKEGFSYVDLCRGLRTADSDKDRTRADAVQRTDRGINGPNKHRLVAVSCEPIGEFHPKVQVLFHTHNAHSPTIHSARAPSSALHVLLSQRSHTDLLIP